MHPSRACRASTCLYSIYHTRPRAVVQLLLFVSTVSVHVMSGHSVQNDHKKHDHLIRQLSDAGGDYKDDNVPFTSWRNNLDTLRYALVFIVLLLAAHPLGQCFPHCFKLPLITGYLVIGIIAGPFVANLLTQNLVDALSTYVTAMALSFFSFQAGQEIYYPELRPRLKSIVILLSVLYSTAMPVIHNHLDQVGIDLSIINPVMLAWDVRRQRRVVKEPAVVRNVRNHMQVEFASSI
ncbi:hypothetical protein PsorP6_015322 [Peronosclerospora sorghi]|uniref:Uncharacterized protein n=1 Tax=Peronosclerospora sorghi TaxID=230839 RepID=A0ACC0VRW8_9STRA|nr:hypothetical protein PsorP6_015322 [Peronosclerospora sorghi]